MRVPDQSAFSAGQPVEWLYEQRGGYGLRAWVLAMVERVGPKRVRIVVERQGRIEHKSVRPDRLRVRSYEHAADERFREAIAA